MSGSSTKTKGRKKSVSKTHPYGNVKNPCTYCMMNIPGTRVKCTECTDDDIVLCLQCFACGAEIGKHKRDHGYKLLNKPVFSGVDLKWSGEHELLLLDLLTRFGYGNWKEIAKRLGKEFTPDEVKEHYDEIYVDGEVGQQTWNMECPNIPDLTDPFPEVVDSPPLVVPDITLSQQMQLGYLPLRDEFELEYDDSAEEILCNLDFLPETRPEDDNSEEAKTYDLLLQLQQACLDIYNRRLQKRQYVKKIAREHLQIKDFFKAEKLNVPVLQPKPLTGHFESFQDFKEQMIRFARFYTAEEFRKLYENLKREDELKARVKEVSNLIRLGFRTFAAARKAGVTKLKSVDEMNVLKRRRRKASVTGIRPKTAKFKRPLGRGLRRGFYSECWRRKLRGQHEPQPSTSSMLQPEKLPLEPDKLAFHLLGISQPLNVPKKVAEEKKSDFDFLIPENKSEPYKSPVPDRPSVDLMSKSEKRLVASMGISPSEYVDLKGVILMLELQRQRGNEIIFPIPKGLTKSQCSRIIHFVMDCGWIKSRELLDCLEKQPNYARKSLVRDREEQCKTAEQVL